MANDINMWNDIEDLEKEGKQEQADALQRLYWYVFQDGCDEFETEEELEDKINELVTAYKEKYGWLDNYFSH